MVKGRAFLLLFLVLTSSAFAGMTHLTDSGIKHPPLNEAQKAANILWKKFLKCPNYSSNDKKISRCYKNSFSSDLSELEYNKQLEFLIMDFEVSELYDCSAKIKKAVSFEKKMNHFLCFYIFGNNSALIGQLYLQEKEGALKIYKLKY